MIFSNNLFKKLTFQQNHLKKPVEKLSFSDVAGLKSVRLLKKMNPFTMNTFFPSFFFIHLYFQNFIPIIYINYNNNVCFSKELRCSKCKSYFNLREEICRRPFRSCHQTPQPIASTFQFSWRTENMCIKVQISDIRKSLFRSLVKVILTWLQL